jgi:MFS family permease
MSKGVRVSRPDEPRPEKRRSPQAAFEYRDFRLYQAARLLSTIANQMLSVAVGWQVYELTRRPFDLGLVGLVQFLPAIGLSLLTGNTADRFDRRKIVMVCYAALAATSVLLYVATRAGSATWPIYATMMLFASARAFLNPAGQALVPDIVPKEHFASAVAWSSSVWEIGAILGPALGGWIYSAGGGAGAVYVAGAMAYAASTLFVLAMKVKMGRMERAVASFETVVAGVVYVWKNKVVLGSITLDLFAVLFGGAVALLPVYARDVLHVGPSGLGLLRSAPAVGAAIVAVVIAYRPLRRRTGAIMLGCVAIFGLATVVFGLSRSFWLSLAALTVVGASDMVSVVVRSTLVQIATPPAMRGRVSAVNMVFVGASNELGELESGMTAAWMGTIPSVVFGGLAACAVVLVSCFVFPDLRKVDKLEAEALPPMPE